MKSRELSFKSTLVLVLLTLICIALQAQQKQPVGLSLNITKAYTVPSITNCQFGGTLTPWKNRKLVVVELSGSAPTSLDLGFINIAFFAAVGKAKLQADAVGREVNGEVSWAPCGPNSKASYEYFKIPAQTDFKVLLAFPNIPQDASQFDVLYGEASLGTAIVQQRP